MTSGLTLVASVALGVMIGGFTLGCFGLGILLWITSIQTGHRRGLAAALLLLAFAMGLAAGLYVLSEDAWAF
jgi:hypothetical protein